MSTINVLKDHLLIGYFFQACAAQSLSFLKSNDYCFPWRSVVGLILWFYFL